VSDLEALLRQGLAALEQDATPAQIRKLLAFQRLLAKWNRVYNLTAIRRPEDMVKLHLLDSLTIFPFLRGQRVLDVGTGAGLPGIPLAILDESRQFILLDSNAKKTRFVTQAAIELGLKHVQVENSRIEHFEPEQRFDLVLCRAFASLGDIVTSTRRLLAPGGTIAAQKGKVLAEELAGVADEFETSTFPLCVPGVEAERHLIAITMRG